jgi:outer membrane protein TolC
VADEVQTAGCELAAARDIIRGHEATIERLQSSLVKANQAFELGRQQGMQQERALWQIAQTSQEIERGEFICTKCGLRQEAPGGEKEVRF